jgi:hypothetical protein
VQISALGKLKFAQYAPISGLPEIGFFMRKSNKSDLRPENRTGF